MTQLPKAKSKKTLYIIVCIVFGLTAFGGGYLIGLDNKSNLEDELQQVNQRVVELEEELEEQARAEDAESANSGGFFASQNARARDAKRESDVKSLQTAVEAYYTIEGSSSYPSEANMNDTDFRDTNFQGLDESVYRDPNAEDGQLASAPGEGVYSYKASPDACDGETIPCDEYTLTVTLEEGDVITRENLQ